MRERFKIRKEGDAENVNELQNKVRGKRETEYRVESREKSWSNKLQIRKTKK